MGLHRRQAEPGGLTGPDDGHLVGGGTEGEGRRGRTRRDGELELGKHPERQGRCPVGGRRARLAPGRRWQRALAGDGRQGARCVAGRLEVLRDEPRPRDGWRQCLGATELDGDRARPDLELGAAGELRAPHRDARPEGDAEADRPEPAEVDVDAGRDPGIGADLEPERVEVDDAVSPELHPRPDPPEVEGDHDLDAGHQRLGRQREVGLALDDEHVADLPDDPQPRHHRVAVAVEAGVVAAHRHDKLSGERPLPPQGEREAAGEPDIAVEQPGVVGELGLHEEDALARREVHEQRQLDGDDGRLRPREGHPSQSEQVDVQPVAEGHGDDRDAVDEAEAGEGDARREPEVAHLVREALREAVQLVHRVGRRRGAWVERLDEGELAEPGDVLRDDQAAVDAQSAAEAGQEEGRRTADRSVDRAEDEEARVAVAVVGVAAEDRQPVCREPPHEHAHV